MPTESVLQLHLEMIEKEIFRGECLMRRQRVLIRSLRRSPLELAYAKATLVTLKELQTFHRRDQARVRSELEQARRITNFGHRRRANEPIGRADALIE